MKDLGFCVSFLLRGHVNLLCITPNLYLILHLIIAFCFFEKKPMYVCMAYWLYVLKHFYSCANERQDDGQQHEPSRCLYNHRQPPTSNHTNDWRGNTSSLLSKARRNDKTTNRPPSIPVKPWCPQVTGPRHHDRQTTDRRTYCMCMYVCMYVWISAMTKWSIKNFDWKPGWVKKARASPTTNIPMSFAQIIFRWFCKI